MFDDWGETLGGITDSIISGGESWVDGWFANETNKVKEAAPEQQRPKEEPARQPDGQPINYQPLTSTNMMLMIGGGMVVLVVFMFLMTRGK